jgi:hypothetical protein
MAEYKHSSVPAGFKEIPGYGGRYLINEKGDVWSIAKSRLMSPQTSGSKDYPWVLITENDKKKQPRTIHYLMRLTWMLPAPGDVGMGGNKWCVNHKDGNKLNNHIPILNGLLIAITQGMLGRMDFRHVAKQRKILNLHLGK